MPAGSAVDTWSDGDDPILPPRSVQRTSEIRIRASGDHAASSFEPPLKLLHTGDFANHEQMRAWISRYVDSRAALAAVVENERRKIAFRVLLVTLVAGVLGNRRAIFSRRAPHMCDIGPTCPEASATIFR